MLAGVTRRRGTKKRSSVHDGLVVVLVDAVAEVGGWWRVVVELGDRVFVHPAANEMRFVGAVRVLSQLEQLESQLCEVLRQLGHPPEQPSGGEQDADAVPPSARRRTPESLRGVPQGHWTDPGELEQLTYQQLYDMTLADDPRDLDDTAAQWMTISAAAAARAVQFTDSNPAPRSSDVRGVPLAALTNRYRELAATGRRCAQAMQQSAASLRHAQQRMKELGPP